MELYQCFDEELFPPCLFAVPVAESDGKSYFYPFVMFPATQAVPLLLSTQRFSFEVISINCCTGQSTGNYAARPVPVEALGSGDSDIPW